MSRKSSGSLHAIIYVYMSCAYLHLYQTMICVRSWVRPLASRALCIVIVQDINLRSSCHLIESPLIQAHRRRGPRWRTRRERDPAICHGPGLCEWHMDQQREDREAEVLPVARAGVYICDLCSVPVPAPGIPAAPLLATWLSICCAAGHGAIRQQH